jgi:uncharacterized protein with PIN domain
VSLVAACAERPVPVPVRQPIGFPHDTHLAYFASGQHRREKIQMHLTAIGQDTAPDELSQGKCAECHDDLAEKTACAGCHVLFQDPALRDNKPLRRCVACHRGAWSGSLARIANTDTCIACHAVEPPVRLAGDVRTGVRPASARDVGLDPSSREDLPWIQINTIPANVYFSHRAHTRSSIACTDCHLDVSSLSAPPTAVRAFSMTRCLRCHAQRGASTDCLTCHK